MLGRTLAVGTALMAPVGQPDFAPTPLARLLRALAANAGEGQRRIACEDPAVARVLRREGVEVDPDAPMAWAASEAETRAYARSGKLVLCGNPDWVPAGAAVVVEVEGGRPVYTVYQEQVRKSGLAFRAAVLHYAKERR